MHIHSLSTGVVSITGKETIRVRIQKSLDSHSFHGAKFKRKEKLITLDYLARNVEVDKSPMVFNPSDSNGSFTLKLVRNMIITYNC